MIGMSFHLRILRVSKFFVAATSPVSAYKLLRLLGFDFWLTYARLTYAVFGGKSTSQHAQ